MDTQRVDLKGIELADRSDEHIRAALSAHDLGDNWQMCFESMRGVRDIAHTEGLGLKGMAARIPGIADGVLSQMFTGNYPGNYVARCRKLAQYLADCEKRRVYGRHEEFVETAFARGMFRIFDEALYDQRIHMVQSPEQLGKSEAAREYVRRAGGGRALLVTLQDGGPSDPFGIYLRDVALAAGIEDVQNRKLINLRYAARTLLELCDVVIIDEFHQIEHWPDKSVRALLEHIKLEIHANGRRGVALVATNSDIMTLLEAFKRRTRYNLGQILGRMCNEVNNLHPDEIPFGDVELLAGRYTRFNKPTLRKLHDIAREPGLGHYGLLLDILNRCWRNSKLDNVPMTDDQVMKEIRRTLDEIENRPKGLYK